MAATYTEKILILQIIRTLFEQFFFIWRQWVNFHSCNNSSTRIVLRYFWWLRRAFLDFLENFQECSKNSKIEQFFLSENTFPNQFKPQKNSSTHFQINQTVATYKEKNFVLQMIRILFELFFLSEINEKTFFYAKLARRKQFSDILVGRKELFLIS